MRCNKNSIQHHGHLFLFLLHDYRIGVPLPLKRAWAHKLSRDLISYLSPALLEALDVFLKLSNATLLQLAREHFAFLIGNTNALQLLIILQEESQVLEWDVIFSVSAKLALELGGILATGKSELVDLVLDAIRCVSHENGRRIHASRHLGSRALEGRQKDCVDERRFLILHLLCVLAALSEVRVLVDGTWNQAWNRRSLLPVGAENVWEARGKPRGRLGGAEMELADVIAVVKAECASYRVDRDPLGHTAHVLIECATDEVEVAEDECLLHVKPDGNNILNVLSGIPLDIVDFDLLVVHVFLVVGHHDHEGHVEHIL